MGTWLMVRALLMFQACADAVWFMAHGQVSCVLDNFHQLMKNVTMSVERYGFVDGCVIVLIDSSCMDHKGVMYGVVLLPYHDGPQVH